SKVMVWVALDRAIKSTEKFGLEGPVEKWRALRDRIQREGCEQAFDSSLNSFVQYYGARELDAALLLIPFVAFRKSGDPRVKGTIALIEKRLLHDGFVARYEMIGQGGELHLKEGVFVACTFWLADNYILAKRYRDAERLFERLLGLRNDVGLLSEQYDP